MITHACSQEFGFESWSANSLLFIVLLSLFDLEHGGHAVSSRSNAGVYSWYEDT